MKRVVVIEDQVILRDFIRTLVQSKPMLELIGETGDGLEGFDMCMKLKPDMIILDIILPGLNGVSVMKRLNRDLSDVKVLGFSSFQNQNIVRQMIESGACGLVQKSESLQILESAIEMVSAGQTYFSPNISSMMRDMMLNPDRAHSIDDLTDRECEVLKLIAESFTNKEIAKKLGISVKTAETHRNRIITKLNIHDAPGLTRFAIANGLVDVN